MGRGTLASFTLCPLFFSVTYALHIPIKSPFKSSYTFPNSTSSNWESRPNIGARYVANITLNGVEVLVGIHRDSSDLWVKNPDGLGQFNDTGIDLNVTYSHCMWCRTVRPSVSGTIGVASIQIDSYQLESQAFLNATEFTGALDGLQELGAYGILGLGLNSSAIDLKIRSTSSSTATWGQPLLRNIFQQLNLSELNFFMTLDLTRTDDLEDTAGGTLGIGSYDPEYPDVISQPKLVQEDGKSLWNVMLDGIYVDGVALDPEVFKPYEDEFPAGKGRAFFDIADEASIVLPSYVHSSIYSLVPGAAQYSLFDDDDGRKWILPCDTTTLVEFVFGGERYLIHPLDLSVITKPFTLFGMEWVACVAAFQIDDWDFDIKLGDGFLRNVHSMFNYGGLLPNGTLIEPYVQLLSKVDPTKAIAEVSAARSKSMAKMPPQMEPKVLAEILQYVNLNMTEDISPDLLDSISPCFWVSGATSPNLEGLAAEWLKNMGLDDPVLLSYPGNEL